MILITNILLDMTEVTHEHAALTAEIHKHAVLTEAIKSGKKCDSTKEQYKSNKIILKTGLKTRDQP